MFRVGWSDRPGYTGSLALVDRSDRPGYTDSRLRAHTYQFIQLCFTAVPGG
ncbi:hypothetical protein DPMN_161014 [Dreissena polymorpha]|uniref:Uncharacterized protein n=1 Tax=Dreissena polymorpha TaxID=45954 RepID=A0A9D4ERC5_DREPO|nr:hypothetical protein DPMN_161014 [Dreissena polymorpha]